MPLLLSLLGFAVFLGVRAKRFGPGLSVLMFAFTCVVSVMYLYLYFKI